MLVICNYHLRIGNITLIKLTLSHFILQQMTGKDLFGDGYLQYSV